MDNNIRRSQTCGMNTSKCIKPLLRLRHNGPIWAYTDLHEAEVLISRIRVRGLNPPRIQVEGLQVGISKRISACCQVRIKFDPGLERQGPLDPDQAVVWGLYRNYIHNNGSNYDLHGKAPTYRAQDEYPEHENKIEEDITSRKLCPYVAGLFVIFKFVIKLI